MYQGSPHYRDTALVEFRIPCFLILPCTVSPCLVFFFFFNDTATTEIYTLSLHDALPISEPQRRPRELRAAGDPRHGVVRRGADDTAGAGGAGGAAHARPGAVGDRGERARVEIGRAHV